MRKISGIVRTGGFALLTVFWGTAAAQECINFVRPVTGSSITAPVCTLEVEKNDCKRSIRKVEFQARYFAAGADTPTVISIGTVSRSPYLIEWDVSEIPNQLFSGASFLAEAKLSNGDLVAARQEGVFFLHQKVERLKHQVPFAFAGTKKIEGEPIALPAPRPGVSIKALIYWNEKELAFLVHVLDPKFTGKLSPEQLASQGCEILLDPQKERKPFPGKDVFLFSVPLNGKPYRIIYKPVPNDSGSFSFQTSTSPADIKAEVTMTEGEGFSIYCPLPIAVFGDKLPQSLSCNLVVKTLASAKEVKRTSWVNASVYETYSPYLWGELLMQERPVYMSRVLFGSVAFGGGLLVTLLIAAVVMFFTRPAIKNIAEQSDEDRQQFTAIREVLDSFVIASVSIDAAAKALEMTPKKLNTLLRKTTGMTFHDYMMYARIEIAKERLRSSHCSEETIALACGFHSQAEMEKFFLRFNHQTPAKFRSEQQVV
ncbi:MAG: AraC family transcriptional regulator [Chitinispirillaceae bacterium]|nr:AraC family transcriptional regulator [Chitinispirillaceae bacterium]